MIYKYKIGDKVLCPPSGNHCGPRKGTVIRLIDGCPELVVVKYFDPPEDFDAQVTPIKKLKS